MEFGKTPQPKVKPQQSTITFSKAISISIDLRVLDPAIKTHASANSISQVTTKIKSPQITNSYKPPRPQNMASNPHKPRDLNKLGKEAFAILSNFPPRKGKAKLVPVKNGSGKNEKCIDAYQAAKEYGGYVLTTCPPQTKTVKQPVTKGSVYSVHQHYYQSPA